jgi:hypothetical protein
MKRTLVALLLVLVSVPALAQEALTPAAAPPVETAPAASPGAAVGLSLGATLASYGALFLGAQLASSGDSAPSAIGFGVMALGFSGTIVGPSLGHLYAGDKKHALLTTGLRLATGGLFASSLGVFVSDANSCVLDFDEPKAICGPARVLTDASFVALVGLGVYDIIDAARAPKRASKAKERSISLAPAILPTAGGPQVSLAIGGSF